VGVFREERSGLGAGEISPPCLVLHYLVLKGFERSEMSGVVLGRVSGLVRLRPCRKLI
jgi:hypothetical protein